MLDRARATSLGLLGATAAVGLAIVALGLNQDWPLIPGGAIPGLPPRHQAVRAAVVAEPAGGSTTHVAAGPARRSRRSHGRVAVQGPSVAPGGGSEASAELVVSHSSPVTPQRSTPHHQPAPKQQPTAPQPAAPESPPPEAAKTPAPVPVSSPAPPPSAIPEASPPAPTPPVAATTEPPPEESNLPPWSNGNGHAYGREDGGHGHGGGDDED